MVVLGGIKILPISQQKFHRQVQERTRLQTEYCELVLENSLKRTSTINALSLSCQGINHLK